MATTMAPFRGGLVSLLLIGMVAHSSPAHSENNSASIILDVFDERGTVHFCIINFLNIALSSLLSLPACASALLRCNLILNTYSVSCMNGCSLCVCACVQIEKEIAPHNAHALETLILMDLTVSNCQTLNKWTVFVNMWVFSWRLKAKCSAVDSSEV